MDDQPATVSLRCSDVARSERFCPAGSAGSYAALVAAELPLPWPGDVATHPAVAPVAGGLAAAGFRLQALVPDPAGDHARRVLTFVRPDGPFRGYATTEWEVPPADLAPALAELAGRHAADARGPDGAGGAGERPAAGGRAGAGRHVLVCTHGARDACCGSLGTRLATALPDLGPGVRAWRTSHTGGHRFAPTALVLPEGTAWAYLDVGTLVGVVDRTLDPSAAVRHYRGCTGLREPEVQAADGAALGAVGWSWLDHARAGSVVERDGALARVRLEGTAPDGSGRVLEAEVETVRTVPVPDCGRPLSDARKTAPELAVRHLTAA